MKLPKDKIDCLDFYSAWANTERCRTHPSPQPQPPRNFQSCRLTSHFVVQHR